MPDNKHKHYEILNLIGYGLAKFDRSFIQGFGFTTKNAFYNHIVQLGIAETVGTVKNRQDLFDPFFENNRKGWWQKGETYKHRKVFIDSLFGGLDSTEYVAIVRMYIEEKLGLDRTTEIEEPIKPILRTKFKQLQLTGKEAELFFIENYQSISCFDCGLIEDARLFGDGYDFQIQVLERFYLAEIKGVRLPVGSIRMTKNEFLKAQEFQQDYGLIVVSNLEDIPKMTAIFDPVYTLDLMKEERNHLQIHYLSQAIHW